MSKPKCPQCGKEVKGIGELDVPYHVECMLDLFQRIGKEEGTGSSGTLKTDTASNNGTKEE